MKPLIGIYTITNTQDGKRYVGQSVDIHRRWECHKKSLRKGNHANSYIQRAWARHGEPSFVFSIAVQCTIAQLNLMEGKFIAQWKTDDRSCGYNLTSIINGTHCHSASTKQKIASALQGRKRKRSAVKKTAKAHRGKIVTSSTRAKLSKANKGKVLSIATRKKMSASKMGNKSKTGIAASKAACAKASASMKAYWENRKATEALANEILAL